MSPRTQLVYDDVCLVAASTVSTDGEKLECLYVGRVSRGSEEERHLLETVDSIEGSLSATVFVCACVCLCVSICLCCTFVKTVTVHKSIADSSTWIQRNSECHRSLCVFHSHQGCAVILSLISDNFQHKKFMNFDTRIQLVCTHTWTLLLLLTNLTDDTLFDEQTFQYGMYMYDHRYCR